MLLKKIDKNKKFYFTTGHLKHLLGMHEAVRTVEAVHAHIRHDAMHQYVMTNLSLRDTIRRRQEQPVIGWRESRLTAKEKRSGIEDQLCQEDGDTAMSSLQSPHSMLFISRSAYDISKESNCLKRANLRQQVLSCLILGDKGSRALSTSPHRCTSWKVKKKKRNSTSKAGREKPSSCLEMLV